MSCSAWIFKIPNELFVARMVHCSTLLQSQPTKLLVMGVNPLYSCVRTNRLTLQQPGPIIVRTSLHQNQPQSKTLSASALMRNLWQSGRLFYGVKCLWTVALLCYIQMSAVGSLYKCTSVFKNWSYLTFILTILNFVWSQNVGIHVYLVCTCERDMWKQSWY